jgi:glycosyltransferase involved in cell wall biosynthesis
VRIAVVGPTHPYKGGPAQHATELAHRLTAAGVDVRLESWSAQYPHLLYPGTQTVEAPEYELFDRTARTLSWRRPDSWWRLGRRLRTQVDAVVLFVYAPVQVPPYLGILAGLGRRGAGGRPRVVALCNNVLPHERSRVDRPAMRALLSRVDAVLVHSGEQAELAHTLTPAPVRVATLAPHLPARSPAARNPARGSDEPAEAGEPVHHRLLFFGVVRPYKGLDLLLRALAAGPPEVALTVAGEFWGGTGPFEQQIAELGLGDRVDLRPGYVSSDAVPELFAAADALVLPYRTATSSQNPWIAFEQGIPVIATSAGTLADPIRDGVDGLVCAPGDVDALTAALWRFYQPGTLQRLRAEVHPVDPEPYWKRYVDTLVAAAGVGDPAADPASG